MDQGTSRFKTITPPHVVPTRLGRTQAPHFEFTTFPVFKSDAAAGGVFPPQQHLWPPSPQIDPQLPVEPAPVPMDIFELEEDNQEPESDDEPDGPEPENDVAAPTLPPFMDTPDAAPPVDKPPRIKSRKHVASLKRSKTHMDLEDYSAAKSLSFYDDEELKSPIKSRPRLYSPYTTLNNNTKLNRSSSAMDLDDGSADGYVMQIPMDVQFPEINLPPAESSEKGIDRREYTYLVPESSQKDNLASVVKQVLRQQRIDEHFVSTRELLAGKMRRYLKPK